MNHIFEAKLIEDQLSCVHAAIEKSGITGAAVGGDLTVGAPIERFSFRSNRKLLTWAHSPTVNSGSRISSLKKLLLSLYLPDTTPVEEGPYQDYPYEWYGD